MRRDRESAGVRPLVWVQLVLAVIALSFSSGCDRSGRESRASHEASAPALGPEHRFAIGVGAQSVQMRLAVLDHERARGLMHVPSMPEDEGMLFLFEAPQRMSFYMRNTRIPLDIGYFTADGVLQEVHPMHPFVEDSVMSVHPEIRFALEMNQGWFARHGVRPGAQLDLAAVRAGLEARGLSPGRYLDSP